MYKQSEILSLSFESNNEFLFSFSLESRNSPYCMPINDFSILSIYEISKNIIQIKFTPKYRDCESQYYLIVAKKNDLYNNDSFSDPCYLLKLLNQKSTNSILIKSIFVGNYNLIINTVDISQLNLPENSELIATVINYMTTYDFYKPLEFILKDKKAIEFKLEEVVYFNFDDKTFFKFEYKYESDSPQEIYFSFDSRCDFTLYLLDNNKTKKYDYE